MKTFLVVLIISISTFAQIQSISYRSKYSKNAKLSQSLDLYHLVPHSLVPYFDIIKSENYTYKSELRQRMDSIVANSINGDGIKLLFEYDLNDNFKNQVMFTKDSGTNWELYSRYEYFYDVDSMLVQRLHFGWNQNDWDTLARLNYEYNTQGLLNQTTYQIFTGNSWENDLRTTYQYDSFENEIQRVIERWDSGWENQYLHINYFSILNKRDSLLFQVWNSTEWENNSKTIFYYNQQTGFVDYLLTKVWNAGIWENSLQRTITNDDNGNQILQIDELWNGSGWENSIRRFYAYDDLDYILSANCERWNGNQWYLDDGDIWIINPDGFIRYFNMNSVLIYYKTTGLVDDKNNLGENFILSQNYPNPFNSSTTIKYTIPFPGVVTIKIYDFLGNEIAELFDGYQESGGYNIIFQADKLSSGIYFYQLQTKDFISTKKIILLK